MAYLEEITSYKEKLMQAICTSDPIVEMLRLSGETTSGKDMRYKRIFPYAYVPDTAQDAQPFVCFEVEVPSVVSGAVKNASIYTYAIAHQSLMRTNSGVWIDVMSSQLDRLLNGNTNYALGKLELRQCKICTIPATGYHGRMNVYSIQDLNRLCGGI